MIATRALMGIGGALIMPSTLSILTNVFPAEERGRAIGIWAGVSGLGIAIGPIVGGWLLSHFWWGSVFLVNVPVVIVALIAGRLIVPDSKDPHPSALDPVGAVLSIVGLVSLVYGIIEAPGHGWTSPETVLTLGFALLVLARVRGLGVPQRPPDARRHVLREPAVHRGEHLDRDGVLRALRIALLPDAVPAVRAGLHGARSRDPDRAARAGADGVGAARRPPHRAGRQQGAGRGGPGDWWRPASGSWG